MKIKIPERLLKIINPREEKEEISIMSEIEKCGVLIGERKGEEMLVKDIIEVENDAGSRFYFELKAEKLYKASIEARKRGMEIIAVFHTHPGGSGRLSSRDVEGLKNSGIPWVIVGLEGARAYFYDKGIKEIDLEFY